MNLNNLFILGPRMHLRTSLYEINRVALMIKSDFAKSQNQFDLFAENQNEMTEQDIEREWDFYHQTIAMVTNNALFCQLFSEYELYMIRVMDMYVRLKPHKNYNEPLDKGSTYKKYLDFINKELKINDHEHKDHWKEIILYRDLRNRMVHSGARYTSLCGSDKNAKLRQLIDTDHRFMIESFLLPEYEGIRETEYRCFYVKDISILTYVSELMLTDADIIIECLKRLVNGQPTNELL